MKIDPKAWRIALALSLNLSLVSLSSPSLAATPTCYGKRATIVGTNGNNTLNGTGGADVIVGKGGNDTISGGGGNDRICGGAGADVLKGGAAGDKIAGGSGRDRLYGGPGKDTTSGGNDRDVCSTTETVSSCELQPRQIALYSPAIVVPVDDPHKITATVKTQSGARVPGIPVIFTATPQNGATLNSQGKTVETGDKGRSAFSLTSSTPGSAKVRACFKGPYTSSACAEVTLRWETPETETVTLYDGCINDTVGSTHGMAVGAADQFGRAISGVVIDLTHEGHSGEPTVTIPEGQTIAQFEITGVSEGDGTTAACLNAVCDTITTLWRDPGAPPPVGAVVLTQETTAAPTDSQHTLTAALEDGSGNEICATVGSATLTMSYSSADGAEPSGPDSVTIAEDASTATFDVTSSQPGTGRTEVCYGTECDTLDTTWIP